MELPRRPGLPALTRLDASFAALSDATRRGVIEQLWHEDASITELAERFQMTFTEMKKHVSVLSKLGWSPPRR
jgi:DNA-binding transcriptional ArsR family regulator